MGSQQIRQVFPGKMEQGQAGVYGKLIDRQGRNSLGCPDTVDGPLQEREFRQITGQGKDIGLAGDNSRQFFRPPTPGACISETIPCVRSDEPLAQRIYLSECLGRLLIHLHGLSLFGPEGGWTAVKTINQTETFGLIGKLNCRFQ